MCYSICAIIQCSKKTKTPTYTQSVCLQQSVRGLKVKRCGEGVAWEGEGGVNCRTPLIPEFLARFHLNSLYFPLFFRQTFIRCPDKLNASLGAFFTFFRVSMFVYHIESKARNCGVDVTSIFNADMWRRTKLKWIESIRKLQRLRERWSTFMRWIRKEWISRGDNTHR